MPESAENAAAVADSASATASTAQPSEVSRWPRYDLRSSSSSTSRSRGRPGWSDPDRCRSSTPPAISRAAPSPGDGAIAGVAEPSAGTRAPIPARDAAGSAVAGTVTVNVLPTPGVLVSSIRPPCAETRSATSASPMPAPSLPRRRPGRSARTPGAAAPARCPDPVSVTASSAELPDDPQHRDRTRRWRCTSPHWTAGC